MRCRRVKRLPVHREKPSLSLTAWFFLWTECWVGVVLHMIEYSKASVPFVAVERCCGQLRQHDKRLREGAVVLIAHRNNATATTIPARRLALQQVNACGQGTGTAIRLGWGSVCEWRCCTTVHGASHRAHCLQTTLPYSEGGVCNLPGHSAVAAAGWLIGAGGTRVHRVGSMSRSSLNRLLCRRAYPF